MKEAEDQPLSPLPNPEIVSVPYRPDKAMALAIFNKAYMGIMPVADRTLCLQVSLTFLHPDPNGMPGADEQPALERFGDAMSKLFNELNAAFAVRHTVGGVRSLYFYVAPNSSWKECLQKYLKSFPGYRIHANSSLDPEWKLYRKFLPLAELWRQIELAKALMKNLESAGDDLKSPRMIDHSAEFKDSKGRDAFIAWATENGFTMRESEKSASAGASDLKLGFQRMGTYDATFLYHLQYHILVALARTGGRYLGNGSSVISRK